MSLKSRSIVFLVFLSSALVAWSCGGSEPRSPGSPSSFVMTGPSGQQQDATDVPVFTETDETNPDPADDPPEDAPPAPGPAPGPPAPPPPPPPPDPNFAFNPGPPPKPAPGAFVPEPPTTSHPRLEIKIIPSVVVPFSGKFITDVASCRDSFSARDNTWFYDQIIVTRSGIGVTISERRNYFDGRLSSTIKDTIRIGGNSTYTIHSKWCSSTRKFHYVQSQFLVRDDEGQNFTFNGPWVRLYPESF
jgi:hypothetical protein